MWDALWHNGKLATMTGSAPFGLHDRGAIGVVAGRIAWVGPSEALPAAPGALAREVHDLAGRLLTPGLVDPMGRPSSATRSNIATSGPPTSSPLPGTRLPPAHRDRPGVT